jgi:hypothetical protein
MRKPFVWLGLAGLLLLGFNAGYLTTEYYEDGLSPTTVLGEAFSELM